MTISVRPLRSASDYASCVELQRLTWGATFADIVPPTILKVTQRIGGVAAGAFDDDGSLLGFVFGITGVEGGALVHWSDMLAVRPEARDSGLGRRLKAFQREQCARLGVTVIYWTYDPLVAKNAHLNLNRLGVRTVEYVENMYGESQSDLHRGVGTDRFVVAWPVTPAPDFAERDGTPESVAPHLRVAPCVNAAADGDRPGPERFAAAPPSALRIEIPLDIAKVQADSLAVAAQWRSTSRRAFLWALANGYAVSSFYRDPGADRGYYVLSRESR